MGASGTDYEGARDGLLIEVELGTLLAEEESIVNNRPIAAVSDDPDDCSALTPHIFSSRELLNFHPEYL